MENLPKFELVLLSFLRKGFRCSGWQIPRRQRFQGKKINFNFALVPF